MKPKTDPIIKTHAELARRLGVSRQLVSCHARRDDAPKPKLDGSLDLERWREYLAATMRLPAAYSKADRVRLGKLKIELLSHQCAKASRENKLASGQLHDAKTCDMRKGHALEILFSELDRHFCHNLPPMFVGKTAPECQKLCAEKIEQFRASLISEFQTLDATPTSELGK